MLILSTIWNCLCLALCIAMACISKTSALEGVVAGVLFSAISWAIINILLALFLRKEDAFSRAQKSWSTFYGFVASVAIIVLCGAYISGEGAFPLWKLAVGIIAVFAGRALLWCLYSKKRITRLLEKSIVIDNSEKDIATVTYNRASLLLPKIVDIAVPHNECGGFYKKDQTVAFLSVAGSIVPISAPADCVCAWLAFDLDEVMVTYKVIQGVKICALAFAGERVCGADETVKGE